MQIDFVLNLKKLYDFLLMLQDIFFFFRNNLKRHLKLTLIPLDVSIKITTNLNKMTRTGSSNEIFNETQ